MFSFCFFFLLCCGCFADDSCQKIIARVQFFRGKKRGREQKNGGARFFLFKLLHHFDSFSSEQIACELAEYEQQRHDQEDQDESLFGVLHVQHRIVESGNVAWICHWHGFLSRRSVLRCTRVRAEHTRSCVEQACNQPTTRTHGFTSMSLWWLWVICGLCVCLNGMVHLHCWFFCLSRLPTYPLFVVRL